MTCSDDGYVKVWSLGRFVFGFWFLVLYMFMFMFYLLGTRSC